MFLQYWLVLPLVTSFMYLVYNFRKLADVWKKSNKDILLYFKSIEFQGYFKSIEFQKDWILW